MTQEFAHAGAMQVRVQHLKFNRNHTYDFASACNALQSAFHFELGPKLDSSTLAPFELADGNYDLDSWLQNNLSQLDPRRPLVIITGAGYGDTDFIGDPDGHYFADFDVAMRYEKVLRADHFTFLKDLPQRMRVLIRCVDKLVAEVSTSNANVLFELGFADAIHKDSLLLSSVKPLPFDIGHRHCLFYENLEDLEFQLRRELGV